MKRKFMEEKERCMAEYNDMMREVEKQGELYQHTQKIEQAVRHNCEEIRRENKAQKLFLLGCGDSYFGGLAVKHSLDAVSDTLVLPMTALEFSQYGVHQVDAHSTVVAVSMSGNVARTIEGLTAAQSKGAYVVGITNSAAGKLYQMSKHPILLGLEEEEGWTPGTLTYCGTLYALCRLLLEFAAPPERGTLLEQLAQTMRLLADVIARSREMAQAVGGNLVYGKPGFPVYVLGAGPSYATAKYGAAKFLEICDVDAIGQESEEFAHQEFWVVRKTCPVFIVAPKGPGFARTREVAHCLRRFGCDLIVLSSDEELLELGKYSFPMPEAIPEALSPLAYAIPLQLCAYYFSQKQGLDPDRRSHNDPFRKKISRLLTRGFVTND